MIARTSCSIRAYMTYDCILIGLGTAGAFSAFRFCEEHPELKIWASDIGKKWAKRRRQLEGFFGSLVFSSGKFYESDLDKLSDLVGKRQINKSSKYISKLFKEVSNFKTIKDRSLSSSLSKKINKFGYDYHLNNYIQVYPKEIHALSKLMAKNFEECKNIEFNFDTEVLHVSKHRGLFVVQTEHEEIKSKKLILATGRSGWRWNHNLFKNFGIVDDNNFAKFGIRIELPDSSLKDFNNSNCTIYKNDKSVEIGPLSWHGTVIPEDHVDIAISSFRSNEDRWETDKVSFNLIGNISMNNEGVEQTERIAKLLFILSNDRVVKEKISTIMNEKSKISIHKEYDWIKEELNNLTQIMPDLLTKGYYYIPTIVPLPSKINIGSNLETEVDGMYVVGENTGIVGLYNAACSGIIAADAVAKTL